MAKHWFITGTSSGLGAAMAAALLERGDRVTGTSRRPDGNRSLATRHGAAFTDLRLDLADPAAIAAAADAAFRDGRVDVVVGNAAYGLVGAGEELSDAALERQLAVNLLGAIRLVRATLPHLRRQGGGRFLQVSSEGGQIAYPNFSAYHASKWGIEGFIEAVRAEVAEFGIRFILAEPGPTDTGFGTAIERADPIDAYERGSAGAFRRRMADGTAFVRDDAGEAARAMIAAADAADPPFRLPVGRTAAGHIAAALRTRLAEVEEQMPEGAPPPS